MRMVHQRNSETREEFLQRLFWSYVPSRIDGECWLWGGQINRSGYGKFMSYAGGKSVTVSAHRFSFQISNGAIPKSEDHHGTVIAHRCDNRRCVNPAHLFACSQAENLRDCLDKGRGNKAFGARAGRAKLSEAAAKLALSLAREGLDRNKIAARLNVTPQTISDVVSGKTWGHLDREGIVLVDAIPDHSNAKPNSGSFKRGSKGNPGPNLDARTVDYALLKRLHSEGRSFRGIAKLMGTTHTTVRRAVLSSP